MDLYMFESDAWYTFPDHYNYYSFQEHVTNL